MKLRWLALLACLLMTACESSETASNSKTSSSSNSEMAVAPAAQFKAMNDKFDNAMKEFSAAYRSASAADRPKLFETLYPKPADYADGFMELAKENPGSDVAFDSLFWVVQRARDESLSEKAYIALWSDHIENKKLKDVCMSLAYAPPSQKTMDRINELLEKTPHDSVKAAATITLAKSLSQVNKMKKSAGKKELSGFLASCDASDEKIEELYKKVASDYPDEKIRKGSKRTYAAMAEGALFEMKHLAIGKEAPEIEGEDLDGTAFKLSDYRGKVVLLDFWGDW